MIDERNYQLDLDHVADLDGERTPHQRLWVAVIARAVKDATGCDIYEKNADDEPDAQAYLFGPPSESLFETHCDYADLSPGQIRAAVHRLIERGEKPDIPRGPGYRGRRVA